MEFNVINGIFFGRQFLGAVHLVKESLWQL